ncbi:hypothetical protein [Pedobacter nanyangensis]|uniref:hypothetical protein n=1 Tax=Pedobacter nanyangensis TaxID=1562389 RepID=UPI000DE330F0|nr:hypothetical protein [Pedobacter nanyangensis]
MKEKIVRIPANNSEITLYACLGEALMKTQVAEQALSHSITLKKNPDETKEQADEFLKRQQRYTLGHAIKIANEEKLYNISLLEDLNAFLVQRNWLVHNVIPGNEEDFNARVIKNELLDKIESIRDKAEVIHRKIEYDLIDFCESKGKDMSKIRAALELQDQGMRIRKQS